MEDELLINDLKKVFHTRVRKIKGIIYVPLLRIVSRNQLQQLIQLSFAHDKEFFISMEFNSVIFKKVKK